MPPEQPKPVVKLDRFVRKHTNEVDVETLHRRGVKRINYLTFSKVNELVALAVARAFEKYGHSLSQDDARRVERDAREEVGRQIEGYQSGAIPAGKPGDLDSVGERIRQLVVETLSGHDGGGPPLAAFEQSLLEVVDSVISARQDLAGGADSSDADTSSSEKVELLERRLARLKEHVARMEDELEVLESRPEAGIASIYRDVQGLTGADSESKKKKSLLKVVFEENLRLQCKSTSLTPEPPLAADPRS